ncbi:hypothetical protein [Parasphingorhabdus cellanae]|uniref:Lipoprotein n=1 Tax=Parasphingorhabdus cellanae TaxID=2806553 RepID=A0ABX7T4Y6_9SPHN|nr:hypothetical protein [Parasphingorhabdus cellanae]QTD55983.1 hypothetical protein J4G78_17690 [Parasphingorhabdus cellanae]
MKRTSVLMAALLLAACGQAGNETGQSRADSSEELSMLEKAAIEAGVIPDARNVSLSGAFERQSDLGEDRFCAVGSDESGYQIGLLAVFGPDSKCEGLGAAQRNGEDIQITLDSEQRCSFTASFDGVALRIPGNLPESCASYCTPRAVLGGVSFYLVGEGDAVARSTRGRSIENLCPGS